MVVVVVVAVAVLAAVVVVTQCNQCRVVLCNVARLWL